MKMCQNVLLKRKEDRLLLIPAVKYGGMDRVYSTHREEAVVPVGVLILDMLLNCNHVDFVYSNYS